jgi:mannose-6-phosphate isomerase-like protein (cupin superfamily)
MIMDYVIPKEKIHRDGTTYLFQGSEHGGAPISFFWLDETAPGRGPQLHTHPYEEIFLVREGLARFTVGSDTIDVSGGHIVIVPSGMPHKFVNIGNGPLRHIDIHASPHVITQWLVE